jgi:hypothetical protein
MMHSIEWSPRRDRAIASETFDGRAHGKADESGV